MCVCLSLPVCVCVCVCVVWCVCVCVDFYVASPGRSVHWTILRKFKFVARVITCPHANQILVHISMHVLTRAHTYCSCAPLFERLTQMKARCLCRDLLPYIVCMCVCVCFGRNPFCVSRNGGALKRLTICKSHPPLPLTFAHAFF